MQISTPTTYHYLPTEAPPASASVSDTQDAAPPAEGVQTGRRGKTSGQARSEDEKIPPRREDQVRDLGLAKRDREVRTHELAHLSVGGPYVGRASFTYERGSNGVLYAVGGEVSVNTSPVANDPAATLSKAEIIRAAALAPAQPSTQDTRIAANAMQMAAQARLELALQRAQSGGNTTRPDPTRDNGRSATGESSSGHPRGGSGHLDLYA